MDGLMAYACRTGTRRNLAGLRAAGWRLLLSPAGVLRHEGFPYALDNGAWTAFRAGTPFDEAAFRHALRLVGRGADFIVAPDIVCGGRASLDLSLSWLPELRTFRRPVLLPIQPGVEPDDVAEWVLPGWTGVFLGGDTAWKERAILRWGPWCRDRGVWCHVGRVNSARRVALCVAGGVASFDGSSASRYAQELRGLDNARRQMGLPLVGAASDLPPPLSETGRSDYNRIMGPATEPMTQRGVSLGETLLAALDERARVSRRSRSQQVTWLIDIALAAAVEPPLCDDRCFDGDAMSSVRLTMPEAQVERVVARAKRQGEDFSESVRVLVTYGLAADAAREVAG